MKKNNNRKYYLDIMRIIACFAVILIHLTATNNNFDTFTEKTLVIFNGITRFSVPLFFMISGVLFLSKEEIDVKKLYTKNIFKILILISVWLLFYGIFNNMRYGKFDINELSLGMIKQILISFIDNQYHFWFLFPLIAIYICLPILKKISEDKKLLEYFLILFFIFVIGYETLELIFGVGSNKIRWLLLFRPDLICGYSGYFLLGYYLDKYGINKKFSLVSDLLGIISFLVVSFGCLYISSQNGVLFTELSNNFVCTSFFMATSMFIWIKKVFANKKVNQIQEKVILFLSNNTLAVYIFHNLIRYIIEDYGIYNKIIHGPISLLMVCILIFIFCELGSWLIKKIPLVGKYIV